MKKVNLTLLIIIYSNNTFSSINQKMFEFVPKTKFSGFVEDAMVANLIDLS